MLMGCRPQYGTRRHELHLESELQPENELHPESFVFNSWGAVHDWGGLFFLWAAARNTGCDGPKEVISGKTVKKLGKTSWGG
jgi:hypothetical protein